MIGKIINDYMIRNGIERKDLANGAGITEKRLKTILEDGKKIKAMEYMNICRALGVGSLDYFFDVEKTGVW